MKKKENQLQTDNLREVTYKCTNSRCNHTQVIRFWLDEQLLPTTCCVKCKAGFGVELMGMLQQRIGMFPVLEQ